MAKTTIFAGTDAEIKVTLSASNSAFAIGDKESVTELKAEFYISGTYDKEGAPKVTINRDENPDLCFPVEGDNQSLVFHVETDEFKSGALCCTITGKYIDTEHEHEGQPVVMDFVHSMITQINIANKAL